MIRVAIVEDDLNCAKCFEEYVKQYASEKGHSFQVTHFQDGADIAEEYTPVYDIILMDIEMRFMNGMDAAKKIRELDKEVMIIFITNMIQYAIKGYAVNALDYIVKPVSYFALSQCLDRTMEKISRKEKHYLIVKNKCDFMKIEVNDIYYLESKGHDILVHTVDDTLLMGGTMKELEDKLEPFHFCRCNKGYLVNLEHVNAIRDGMAVVSGDYLTISRPRKKIFLEKMAEYMSEVIQ